jgi:excisionase family DNA binding protein
MSWAEPRETKLDPAQRLLTIPEAAAYLGVTENALRHMVKERRVPFTRIGQRNVRFSTEHLARIVAAGEQAALESTRVKTTARTKL